MMRIISFVSKIIVLMLAFILFTNKALAEDLSWVTTKPVVASSSVVVNASSGWCKSYLQIKEISGYSGEKKVCISDGGIIKFGNFFEGSSYSYAIGARYESKMYRFVGPCSMSNDCIYLSGSDTLVTKQNLVNNSVRSLVVYKNFTNRLFRRVDRDGDRFEFDSSNPDYVFKSAPSGSYPNGYAWPVGGIGASSNGEWLAVEFRERGIGLLNIETLQMKRVSTAAFMYGFGHDPAVELAVGNDGEHVALMGMNAGFSVLEVNPNCGDEASDSNLWDVMPISNACKTAQISPGELINRFSGAFMPRFSSDGDQLGFLISSYSEDSKEILMRPSGFVSSRLDYLAMGDSFQSGEGETDDAYYLDGTNDPYEKCHVSSRSYPFLVAAIQGIDLNYVRSVACSGATTRDIYENDEVYLGQDDRLSKNVSGFGDSERISVQAQAKMSFIPGRIYQRKFAEIYQSKVITIGIGGNDAGFMEKLKSCLGIGTCKWAGTEIGREQTAVEIKNLFSRLVQTYKEIHTASPGSKIYVIGYPKIIDPDGECGLPLNLLLDSSEKRFMDEGVIYLNQVISAAAKSAGVKFIDVYNSYGDSVLCSGGYRQSMNGIRIGNDTSPISDIEWLKVIGNESFHPTPTGHQDVAASINLSVGDIKAYSYCGSVVVYCPDNGTKVPEPSEYWVPSEYHNYLTSVADNFIVNDDKFDRQRNIEVGEKSFAPNSEVSIEISSETLFLGKFIANSDGSLNALVELPIDFEEGYHTIHLYGSSYFGEPIDVYQTTQYFEQEQITPVTEADNESETPIIERKDDRPIIYRKPEQNTPVAKGWVVVNETLVHELVNNMPNDSQGTTVRYYESSGDTEPVTNKVTNVQTLIVAKKQQIFTDEKEDRKYLNDFTTVIFLFTISGLIIWLIRSFYRTK